MAIKEVAILEDGFEIEGTEIPDSDLRYELNEWDEYALEEAVRLSEEHGEVEVVAVTIGPDRSEETIRKALAKGADRAIRVWDDTLAERRILDPVMKARILAAVIADESPDLVLSGVQGGDDSFGATGAALAGLVDFDWAAVVNEVSFDVENGIASVHRELEGGLTELADIELPAVLTIQTGINQPRYASLRGIRMAQGQPLEVRDLTDLGLNGSIRTNSFDLTSLYQPESEADTQFFDGDSGAQAGELADLLVDLGVVEG